MALSISPIQVVRGFVWLVFLGVAAFALVFITAVRQRLTDIEDDAAAESDVEADAVFEELARFVPLELADSF